MHEWARHRMAGAKCALHDLSIHAGAWSREGKLLYTQVKGEAPEVYMSEPHTPRLSCGAAAPAALHSRTRVRAVEVWTGNCFSAVRMNAGKR